MKIVEGMIGAKVILSLPDGYYADGRSRPERGASGTIIDRAASADSWWIRLCPRDIRAWEVHTLIVHESNITGFDA